MKNPEQFVTHEEFQEFMQGLLSGISEMMDEKIQRSEDRMMARIEGGIGAQVQANAEKLDALSGKVDAMEAHLGAMTEHMESIDLRLTAVESDMKDMKKSIAKIREKLEEHEDEIITLRRVK